MSYNAAVLLTLSEYQDCSVMCTILDVIYIGHKHIKFDEFNEGSIMYKMSI